MNDPKRKIYCGVLEWLRRIDCEAGSIADQLAAGGAEYADLIAAIERIEAKVTDEIARIEALNDTTGEWFSRAMEGKG